MDQAIVLDDTAQFPSFDSKSMHTGKVAPRGHDL